MCKRPFLIVGCLFLFLTSACVSRQQYSVSRQQYSALEAELKDSRLQVKKADENLRGLEADLTKSEEIRNQCLADLKNLEARNEYQKKINRQLSEAVKNLNDDLDKKKSVIQLQGKVIRLLDDTKKTIETSLKDQIADNNVEIVKFEDKLKVVFIDKILFNSGSTEISERGQELLLLIADSIRTHEEQKIVVEGHTDNVPISSARLKRRFPSNWELSAARAAAVVRFLQEKGGLRPERLEVRGHSFYQPVASNNTEEGRRQNRRIEIILGPVQ